MNKLTEMIDVDYVPKLAVIVYESKVKNEDDNSHTSNYYLEGRRINAKGKMGAAQPLKESTLSKIVKCMAVTDATLNTNIHGEIPENLLYSNYGIDKKVLVWYRKPEERQMFFSSQAGIPDGKLRVPGLVYAVHDNSLSVYAYKGKKPSVLYRAPFYNVGENGVCLGSAKTAKPKELTYELVMQYWEKMFWLSEFVHILGGNPIKGNLAVITKQCIKNNEPFPENVLIKAKSTLKQLYRE